MLFRSRRWFPKNWVSANTVPRSTGTPKRSRRLLNPEKFENRPVRPTIYLSLCFEQQTAEPIFPFRTHTTDSRCRRGGPQRLEQIADGDGCGVSSLATSPAYYRGSGPTCPPLASYEKNWMPCARAIGVSAMVRTSTTRQTRDRRKSAKARGNVFDAW